MNNFILNYIQLRINNSKYISISILYKALIMLKGFHNKIYILILIIISSSNSLTVSFIYDLYEKYLYINNIFKKILNNTLKEYTTKYIPTGHKQLWHSTDSFFYYL